MIHVIVNIGTGSRRKPSVISDDLIGDENSAIIRAKQELAKSSYLVSTRVLEVPHDPAESHAYVTTSFSYQPLGITGRHTIVARAITLSPNWCGDSLTLEQYKFLELP